jgi:hypothetical protein
MQSKKESNAMNTQLPLPFDQYNSGIDSQGNDKDSANIASVRALKFRSRIPWNDMARRLTRCAIRILLALGNIDASGTSKWLVATNARLSDLTNIGEREVRSNLRNLKRVGLIEIQNGNGRRRKIRIIFESDGSFSNVPYRLDVHFIGIRSLRLYCELGRVAGREKGTYGRGFLHRGQLIDLAKLWTTNVLNRALDELKLGALIELRDNDEFALLYDGHLDHAESEIHRVSGQNCTAIRVKNAPPLQRDSHIGTNTKNNPPVVSSPLDEAANNATRISEDWIPDGRLADWFYQEAPELDIRRIVEMFKNHWLAEGGRKALCVDWNAKFQTYVRYHQMFYGPTVVTRRRNHSGAAQNIRKMPI